MKKKIITIGLLSMLLFTSLLAGTTATALDLAIKTNTIKDEQGKPTGFYATVTNVGDVTVPGGVTNCIRISFNIYKWALRLKTVEEATYDFYFTEGLGFPPGDSIDSPTWHLQTAMSPAIYWFDYSVVTLYKPDSYPNNNRVIFPCLILFNHMILPK